jgi:acyl transferase domain-containing protein/thioesterase domain-containing protein
MMDAMVEPLREEIAKVSLRAPSRPFVSTVTGRLISESEATSPEYWAHQARATVEFSTAIRTLKELGYTVFLECGPRATLCSLVRQHFELSEGCVAIPTFGDTHLDKQEWVSFLFALGSLWLNGASVDWDAFYANEFRRRIPLPTYPFERQRYWVDPAATVSALLGTRAAVASPSPSQSAEEPQQTATAAGAGSRKGRLISRLLDLLAPISGHQRDELSPSALFVEQGFDSLSLVQVSVQIEQEFGFKFGFSKLMNQFPTVEMVATHLDEVLPADTLAVPSEAPTPASLAAVSPVLLPQSAADTSIQALAAAVAEQGRQLASIQETLARISAVSSAAAVAPQAPSSAAPAAKPVEVPTTAPQRGIYYSSRLSQNLSGSYNESVTLHIDGQISVPKIKRALESLVERHDALRAAFDPSGQSMRIEPHCALQIPVQDLSSSGAPSQLQEQLKAIALQEAALPFALPGGPFIRCSIFLLGPSSAAVILTVHHIICDGWSIDVLIQDFCAFYSEELSGPGTALAAAPSFADYARHSDQREHSPEFHAAREYWESKFAGGLPALSLPADFPRKPLREHRAVRVDRTIGIEQIEKLRTMAAENGCSLFAASVSALAILLARLSRQTRFVLALSTAEQPFLGQPNLVGHCVSLLPFIVDLHVDEDLTAFMRRVQKELAEAMDHLSFTTIHLMEELVSSSRTRMSPIPVGLTGIKKFRPDELDLRGFSFDYVGNPKSFESFEWYLSAMESSEGLEMHGHYDVELFRRDTIEQWLEDFEKILLELTSHPAAQVFDLAQFTSQSAPVDGQIFTWTGRGQKSLDAASASHPGVAHNPSSAPDSQSAAADASTLLPHLVKLFQRVLGIRTVAVDDNFFDLGGHSVNAARLFALVERELHITAPLAALYEAPTPRKLAGILAGGIQQDRWQSLVPIRAAGSRIPLFLVHGAEGNVLLYRALASHLGENQPVYGLQSAGLDGTSSVDGNIVHVARKYVEEIRTVQPEGPYMLGGYCLGGLIAMEMARQLTQDGQSIGLLAMIENFNIRSVKWPLPLHVRLLNRFYLNPYYHLLNILEADGESRMAFFRQKLNVEIARAKVESRVLWSRARRALNLPVDEEFHHLKIADVWDRALEEHEVVPYPGEITLFTTERTLMGMSAPQDGWAGLALGGIREFKMPFSPKASMTEPYVRMVAQRIRACIDDAIARSQSAAEQLQPEVPVKQSPVASS